MDSGLNISSEELAILDRAVEEAHSDENKLPVNSNALLLNENTSRFSSASWFNKIQEQAVILAGLGGIGSHLAFMLSRVNVGKLIIYDSDIVDTTNMSGQLYSKLDVGNSKAWTIRNFMCSYSNFYNVLCLSRNYDSDCNTGNIMICGFDNMGARKLYYNKWKNHVFNTPVEERYKCLFIDGRLAAEEFQVFCITGTDNYLMSKYEDNWLFSDIEADETLCSYKQTSFCANMIASVMTNLFVNFVANLCDPIIERELPFYTEYNAERMYLKTKIQ